MTVVIWILAAVGLLQGGLAARAYLLERREGLPRSTLRCAVSLAIALGLVGVAAVAQLGAGGGAPAAPAARAELAPAARARADELRRKIDALTAELARYQAELAALDPAAEVAPPPAEPSSWPLFVALALVLLGFGAMTLGDLSTLLPRRRPGGAAAGAGAPEPAGPDGARPEPADLPTLVAHASAGRWKAGLACAGRIKIERLHKLEQLDLLYLRAFCGVMTVARPEGDPAPHQERTERLAAAKADLASLLELAPHMAEARWLLGYVEARAGAWEPALAAMRAARPALGAELPFDRNESVCLLMLAEAKLAAADGAGATALFDEVAGIGVLAGQIPVAMVTQRILAVREHLRAGKLAEAAEGVASIRKIEGLDEAAGRASRAACDVYDVALRHRAGELDEALAAARAFFERWLPAKLPDVEDQAADEYLLPAIDKAALPLPAALYRALFFLEAVARIARASRRGQPLEADEVDAIATALLRALQFEPRHREVLAALAALYLAYRAERTEKALAWLDAAITMGVRSARARALLAEHRRAERERQELLALFRSASAKFLSDPAVGVAVRRALVEELGRFEEFRPVVLELQETGALEAGAGAAAITVAGLRERAAFVGGVAAEIGRRGDPAAAQQLVESSRELTALANNVDTSATRIAALERAVMEQLGRAVLR